MVAQRAGIAGDREQMRVIDGCPDVVALTVIGEATQAPSEDAVHGRSFMV